MISSLLTGNLRGIPLPDLLLLLHNNRKTGALFCQSSGVSKVVEWEQGEIVFARSTVSEDHLGHYFLSRRIVTADQLRRAEPTIGSEGQLGKSLVGMGLLTSDSLEEHVRSQVTEIIYSLFHWERGTFDFREGNPPTEKITLNGGVMNLIMEGTRRLDEWSRVREKIQSELVVLTPAKPLSEIDSTLTLSDFERQVLSLVDGRRTVRQVVEQARKGKFQTWQVLHALLSTGVIRIQVLAFDPPSPATAEPPSPTTDGALERALDRYGDAVALMLERAEQARGNKEVARLRKCLREAAFGRVDLLREVAIEPDGRIDRRILLANVAEDPPQERAQNLKLALDSLVRFLSRELKGKIEIDDVLTVLQENKPAQG